jgi:AcrR family transcriptional regulator
MPRISAATVVEHRELRRAALLDAAATLMTRGGSFTVAEVATEVGLSRSAVYEYYSSAADLIADVLVDEMSDWAEALRDAVSGTDDPLEQVEAWIRAVLDYVAGGHHALVRAAGAVDLPATRRAHVQTLHRELIAPLQDALTSLGDTSRGQLAMYVWGVVDTSITRIEAAHCGPAEELPVVLDFVRGGLARTLA